MTKLSLLIIATDITFPKGGLKYMDGLGANGETIIDYMIYDAIRAGFGHIFIIIRKEFEQDIKTAFEQRYGQKITIEFIVNNIKENKLNNQLNDILAAKNVINQPFAIITAGSFYGSESYKIMANYLHTSSSKKKHCALVLYSLENTFLDTEIMLYDLCEINEQNHLTKIHPQKEIKLGETIVYQDEHGHQTEIAKKSLVSMNFWGFTPDIFTKIHNNITKKPNITSLSKLINELIDANEITVDTLKTTSMWMTILSANDKLMAILKINEMVKRKEYPTKLW